MQCDYCSSEAVGVDEDGAPTCGDFRCMPVVDPLPAFIAESALDRLRHTSSAMSASDKAPACLHAIGQPLVNAIHAESMSLWNALAVVVIDPRINQWLRENDPQALRQAERALLGKDKAETRAI